MRHYQRKKRSEKNHPIQAQTRKEEFSFPDRQSEQINKKSATSPEVQLKHLSGFKTFADISLRSPSQNSPTIQREITVGKANDKYEQEADQVASKVVESINSNQTQDNSGNQGIQNKEEESVQRQIIQRNKYNRSTLPREDSQTNNSFTNPHLLLQRMIISKRSDIDESQLAVKPSYLQRQGMESEDEVQMKPQEAIQREEMKEDEDVQMKPNVQKVGLEGGTVTPEFKQNLQQAKNGGQSLQPELQTKMGAAMGADFSGVKVHTNSQSDQLNKSIQAKAFTTGQDVFFKQGEYNPNSRGGQELIAHELTHVVQQRGSTIQTKPLSPEQDRQNSRELVDQNSYIQRNSDDSSSSKEEDPTPTTGQVEAPVDEMKSQLRKDKVIKRGEGMIAATCQEKYPTGGHSHVALEYLTQNGAMRYYVMDLRAAGGKGDSASGGSGTSGSSKTKSAKQLGSYQSAIVSNEDDSGSLTYSESTNSNVGSANPETFKGSLTINVNDCGSDGGYVETIAKRVQRNWAIPERKALKAVAKAEKIKQKADSRKLMYAITGHSISFKREGMNCAKFAEQVLNAAGVSASAGWWIKTPSQLATGKRFGRGLKASKKGGNSSSSSD